MTPHDTIDIRHASHPEAARAYDTAALRRHYLVQDLFRPGACRSPTATTSGS